MSSILDIIFRFKQEGGNVPQEAAKNIEAVGSAAQKANTELKSASGGFDSFAGKVDRAGRSAKIGLNAMGQAAQLAGIDLGGITGPASRAADAIGDMTGSVGDLAEGMTRLDAIGIPVIGALIAAFGLLNTAMQARNDALAKDILANDKWVQSVQRAAGASQEAAKMLEEYAKAKAQADTGWSWDVGDIVSRWEQWDTVGRGVAQMLHGLNIEGKDLPPWLQDSATKAELLKQKLEGLLYAAGGVGSELKTLTGNADAAAGSTGDLTDRNAGLVAMFFRLHPEAKSAAQSLQEFEKTASDTGGVDKMRAAVEQLRSTFQSLVEKALTPTETKLGPDTWDEARKRLEAVATGTDPNQYGDKFAGQVKALEKLGYTAETAAAAFKDMSLFANPDNLALVDWGPVVQDVSHQIDIIIGRANLMKEGFQQAWDALDPKKKADLAKALDVDPKAANAAEKVFDAMQGDKADAAAQTTGEIATNVGKIEGIHTSTINFVADQAKTAIEDFYNNWLKKYILDNANITITVSADVSTPNPNSGSGNNAGGGVGGGIDGAGYATGLDFVVPPGFPSDSYSFKGRFTSGERVQVTPAHQGSHGWGSTPNIIVYVDGVRVKASRIRAMAAHGVG